VRLARLHTLRRAAGLTQADLAAKAGVHTNTIGNLESGKHMPHPGVLARIAEALDVSPAELCDDAPGLRVALPDGALAHVERLHATGLYGLSVEDTVAQLVLAALRREIADERPHLQDVGRST
jgi:transcriptional regulator with XRE-family HTH domain